MRRLPLPVLACLIAACGLVSMVTVMVTAPPAAVAVGTVALIVMASAALLVVDRLETVLVRMESQKRAFVALVEKVAIDQERGYYARTVPADVLAAAGLPIYVYPADAEKEGQS